MYNWYQKAEVCYVYLSDVPIRNAFGSKADADLEKTDFERCRWFTRGWTLQELLAPREVVFFSSEWQYLGTRRELVQELSAATGIDRDVLLGTKNARSTSIAKRMSWAANRRTTRAEDMAYCLMGLFNVNMPMLYGEGEKAFIRLQEEILRTTDDQSIFAWFDQDAGPGPCGLLAHHPKCFKLTGGYDSFADRNDDSALQMVTNRGVSANMFIFHRGSDSYDATLTCAKDNMPNSFAILPLRKIRGTRSQFVRHNASQIMKGALHGVPQQIYVRQSDGIDMVEDRKLHHLYFEVSLRPTAPEPPFSMQAFNVAHDGWKLYKPSDQVTEATVEVCDDCYLASDPSGSTFALPIMPSTLALSVIIRGTDWQVRVRLGTHKDGHVGWDAFLVPDASHPGFSRNSDWFNAFYGRNSRFVYASKADKKEYVLDVEADPPSKMRSARDRCKVVIKIDWTGLSRKSNRFSSRILR